MCYMHTMAKRILVVLAVCECVCLYMVYNKFNVWVSPVIVGFWRWISLVRWCYVRVRGCVFSGVCVCVASSASLRCERCDRVRKILLQTASSDKWWKQCISNWMNQPKPTLYPLSLCSHCMWCEDRQTIVLEYIWALYSCSPMHFIPNIDNIVRNDNSQISSAKSTANRPSHTKRV